MKYNYYISFLFGLFILFTSMSYAQEARIKQIETKLASISVESPGLNEKVDLNVNQTGLTTFLQAIANTHKINLNIAPNLNKIIVTNNFSNATVSDVLVWLCKEYNLDIGFTGNILSIKKRKEKEKPKPKLKTKEVLVDYNTSKDLLSVDFKQDTLYVAFKKIMDVTGKNLVFAPGMANIKLTNYIKNMPFDGAMDKIAFANDLRVTKTRDNYYLFENNNDFTANITGTPDNKNRPNKPVRQRRSNFYFKILDKDKKNLEVDFENTPISSIVYDIGSELNIDMFTSELLDKAGNASVKAKNIPFDVVLDKIFENTKFTYKIQNGIYFFGNREQLSLRNSVSIPLMHRSIEVMSASGGNGRRAGRTNNSYNQNNNSTYNNQNNSTYSSQNNSNINNHNQRNNVQNINTNRSSSFSNYSSNTEALVNILPQDIIKDLEIKIDMELNSFIVSGPSQNIEQFKSFIKTIDKPVPVVLIEVMIIEINKTATLDTGISAGLGDKPVVTDGDLYPSTGLTLNSNSVNRIINSFNGFGSLNIGKVVPNFYIQIKALENNGNLKIKSSPKLSTLNGHRANLSIGETTYYAVTERNVIGTQNPQTSEITNYQPIDAEFAINIRPLVSGDGQITLDINVIQSNFNGTKIATDAPPGINSREFNSIIRVKNQDLIVLGGLEEKIINDSGSGIPLLARIPIIKWIFSKRKRENTRKKLIVLIKPTIIN